MIAYNLDYSTLVRDDDNTIPDSKCNIMKFSDHFSCIVEDTNITSNGFCFPIQLLKNTNNLILSHSENSKLLEYKNQSNFFNQGKKECIELTFEDGSILKCTPDHKIITSNNIWIQSKDIEINKTQIKKSITFPKTIFEDYISTFKINYEDIIYTMDNINNVEKTLKFCRILGYLCTDGIIQKNRATCFVGDIVDANCMSKDIFDICGEHIEPVFRITGSSTHYVRIPYSIHKSKLWKVANILGNKMKQDSILPDFIMNNDCPKILKREFIAGMFGGDGLTVSYCESTKNYTTIGLTKSKYPERVDNLIQYFKNIQKILLDNFDINSYLTSPAKKDKSYNVVLKISPNDLIKFNETIGFRYCTYKSFKLEVLCSYKKLINNVFNQRKKCLEIINNIKNKEKIPWDDAIIKGYQKLKDNEPIFNDHYCLPNKDAIFRMLRKPKDGNKKTFLSKYFPSFLEYITNLGVKDIFINNKLNRTSSIYAMDQHKLDDIPYYILKVISIKNIGKHNVYDIEIEDNHSFLANGVVVHNCEHDPKVIKVNELTKFIDKEKKYLKELRTERDKKCNKLSRDEFVQEIKKKEEQLKPYIDERAKIKKTILKKSLCGERHYKFYKDIKGVIPTILQNLLDARKNTRKQIKSSICNDENCKDIAQYGIDTPIFCLLHKQEQHNKLITDEQVNDSKLLNNVLEKRQLAYKISANSVAGPTPIPCKINGIFSYKTIEELSKENWKRINDEQEISEPIDNLEVWSDMGYTKVKYVMRHPNTEKLYRVNTHVGCVDCTKDHSLLRKNGKEVSPKDLNIKDELLHSEFPLPKDTPINPLYTSISDEDIHNFKLNNLEEELAFVHGMFFAEGTCGKWGKRCKEKSSWIIYNQDLKKLERCKDILDKTENLFSFQLTKYYDSSRCYHLKASGNIKDIVEKYRNIFYDDRKLKKFPEYIFNSNINIRQAFFMGYYNGDGNRNLKTGVVIQNKGRRGCASLYFLARSLGYKVSISYNEDNEDSIFRLQCCKEFRIKETDKIKNINIMKIIEPEYKETLVKDSIINGELIEFKNKLSKYRNVIIYTERYPKQKLIDCIDKAIINAEKRYCYICEYHSTTKKVLCKKYCCGKEKLIKIRSLEIYNNDKDDCNCNKTELIFLKNKKNLFEEKKYNEYVYDLETENHHFAAGIGSMIVHNSMYGAWGVKKGYLPFMPGAMCLDGESQISFSYGFTRKLKNLKNTNYLWSYNNGQIISNGNGLKYNGKKEIVKITLIDGRTLRCTPDHKIMTTEGWVEAGNLLKKYNWDGTNFSVNSNYSKVITGLELPEDIIGEDEKNWSILDYKMDSAKNREITLAFCRVLGFILSDGSISSYKNKYDKSLLSSKVSIGTLLDSQIFVQDIKLITGKEPKITNCERTEIKGNTFSIHIPKVLIDQILLLEDIPIGKRTHNAYTIPSFLFEENCPLSVIREFLGGLFGGDGTSPSLSIGHPSFSPIQMQLITIEKYKEDMHNKMNKIVFLLEKFDIKFWTMLPKLAREREELLPKDIEENPRWECIITTNSCNNLLFAQKIGFRYCSDKNNKLAIASSYQRYSDNFRKQHIDLILFASNIFESDKKITIKDALIKARKKIYQNETPLHEIASLSKSSEVNNHRSRPHSLEGYRLLQKFFPTAREYARNSGCEHWFSENNCSKKVYSMERMDTTSPCFHLDVVDIRYDGIDDVYDIIDVPNHSFLSNGIVVHNCTTFMGRTNIEIVAKTIQEKYGGKLVYGDKFVSSTGSCRCVSI